jgi:GMP synthase (glutamine-hydrolysing)
MRIHTLQHVPFEGLGSILPWAEHRGCQLSRTRLFAGDPVPEPEAFDWLVVMGGPMGVHDESEHPWLVGEKRLLGDAIEAGKVVLGICLGAQLLAAVLGARVRAGRYKEIGWFPIEATPEAARSRVAGALPSRLEVFHWHGDGFALPAGAIRIARSAACENQGFVYAERVVGLQFHLETTPQTAAELVENCGHELVPSPFVQGAEVILSDPRRFETINGVMGRLLDRLDRSESV